VKNRFQNVPFVKCNVLCRYAWGKVSAGSSCHNVFVWDVPSRRLLYKLPGHLGTVNEVAFHPSEPIIGSAGADRKIFLGELAD
jgi:Prp8 binding protein